MERFPCLLKPEQLAKLEKLSSEQNVSKGEVVRRMIDHYESISIDEMKDLNALADSLEQSNKETKQTLNDALKDINDTIEQLKKSNEDFRKKYEHFR